jgi:hypothetical protein
LAITIATAAFGAAEDQILVVEQDYNIIESSKDGPAARDVRQKLYIHKDMVCIDEYGGKEGDKPTESIIVDLKNRKIVNLNHMDKKKVTEDFDVRRKRLEKKKKNADEDLAAQPAGPQRDRVAKLYRALLDDKRRYALAENPGPAKTLAGASCSLVKIVAEDAPEYTPLEAYLHPQIEVPYENADMLYLLQIIGDKLAGFMRKHKETFKHLPMELHLELAAGGRLDTKVITVTNVDRNEFNTNSRGGLGNPFTAPANYEERAVRAPKAETKDRPD